MNIRFYLFFLLLTISINAYSAERFLVSFELSDGTKTLEKGKAIVSQNIRTWKKGLQRNVLKLDCQQKKSGGMKKIYSTEEFFTGLIVTHQLVGNNIEINVDRITGKPRLAEIRALSSEECKILAPIIDRTSATYSFPAKPNDYVAHPFGANLIIRVKIQSIGGTR